jgi:hypothetical protein
VNCDEAYKELGLTPWDEFATAAIERNFAAATRDEEIAEHLDSPLYRRIGTSTWMTVNAALDVLHGGNAGVAGENQRISILLLGQTHRVILALLEKLSVRGVQVSPVDGGVFMVTSHITNTVRGCAASEIHKYVERSALARHWFIEDNWKARLIRRTQGPYQMIREVRLEDGCYRAYAEDDEFLFELTIQGAITAIRNPEIQPVGWLDRSVRSGGQT